mmetsp:Transcript_28595/g.42284  ORF Transcript_28595/g.42284 Transcript_28595/m.42284 type:complete len:230 (+) Transcript_28595:79-768(+)
MLSTRFLSLAFALLQLNSSLLFATALNCKHGGTKKTTEDGQEYCDCSTTTSTTRAYAGERCEHAATKYCEHGKAFSKNSFCVLGYKCNKVVFDNGYEEVQHMGCDCKGEMQGEHCEYTYGFSGVPRQQSLSLSQPSSSSATEPAQKSTFSSHKTMKITIAVVGFATLVAVAFVVTNHVRTRKVDPPQKVAHAATQELDLDPDGEIMQEIHIENLQEEDLHHDEMEGEII